MNKKFKTALFHFRITAGSLTKDRRRKPRRKIPSIKIKIDSPHSLLPDKNPSFNAKASQGPVILNWNYGFYKIMVLII